MNKVLTHVAAALGGALVAGLVTSYALSAAHQRTVDELRVMREQISSMAAAAEAAARAQKDCVRLPRREKVGDFAPWYGGEPRDRKDAILGAGEDGVGQ